MTAYQTQTKGKLALLRFMLDRAKEPSSWRGLILVLSGALGVAIEPALALHIISAGVSIAGLVGILTADKPDEPATPAPSELGASAE
jgi:hypothetical protein